MESSAKGPKTTDLSSLASLAGFTFKEFLVNSKETKTLFFVATKDDQDALFIVSKKDWSNDDAAAMVGQDVGGSIRLQLDEHNSEYYQFTGILSGDFSLNPWKVNITYPCQARHIDKYRPAEVLLVQETPHFYRAATLLYILSLPPQNLDWVSRILDGTKEADRVVVRQQDFVLLPDFKFDVAAATKNADFSSLYLQCIVGHEASLQSVRDVRQHHLPLLERIRDTCLRCCREKFFLRSCDVRLFVHYFPTFYHFHVHVVHRSCVVPGGGVSVGRAILLDDVIQNVRMRDTYYEECTLTSYVRVGTPHHKAFEDAGYDF